MKTQRTLIPLLSVLLTSVIFAQEELPEIKWRPTLDAALEEAGKVGKPIYMKVGSSTCYACEMLDQSTLVHPRVRDQLANFIPVEATFETSPEIVSKYSIGAVPLSLVMSAAGEEVARISGFIEPEEYAKWLEFALASSDPEKARAEIRKRRKEFKQLGNSLVGDDAKKREIAFKTVVEKAAEQDENYIKLLKDYFEHLVIANSTRLYGHLSDEHLIVRILACNALGDDVGSRYDPWAPAAERKRALMLMNAG